jgi:FMN reductase
MLVLAIDGSPVGGGKTATVLQRVLDGAAERGAETKLISLADSAGPDALDSADAFIFGSPVYRASYTGLLKTFLDSTQRGMWGETKAPLQARAAGVVLTGADDHHFLALDQLRSVLAGFFAVHVVGPGLYVDRSAFGEDGSLSHLDIVDRALLLGRSVVDLARAIESSDALAAARPQA